MTSASENITWAWDIFCCNHLGTTLPMNKIEHMDGMFITVHECEDIDPPIVCRDGTVIRRLALAFDVREGVSWS